jgi:hypothetical protein
MAIQPLDQRLSSILPAAPDAAAPETPLEPMPAEGIVDTSEPITAEPGTPSMEDGVQVAGPIDAALRKLVTKAATKAERNIIPGKVAEGELGDAMKAGRYKVIPEADATLTDAVQSAAAVRRVTGNTIGKPSPSTVEAQAGIPTEPFNLSRYQTEDAAAVVGGVADALGIKTKAVTFDEIKAKAAENGISESFLTRLVGNDGRMMANAVETYKALEVLESSANELTRLFKMVNEGNATDADKLKLRQQIAFHGMIQKGVKGMQTETARALAVFRIPREGNVDMIRQVLDQYGGDKALTDMAKSYLQLESRAAQNQMIEKSMFSGVKDIWFTTYINGLLSSPVSHAKNLVGNSLFGAFQIPERLIGAFYGHTLPQGVRSWKSLVPGTADEKIAYGEALTMVQSLRNGFAEGLELASTAWKSGKPNDLMSKIEEQRGLQESMGETLQRVTGASPDTWLGKGLDYYGTAIALPGRALMTQDEFFKGVFYRMELNAQVTRRGKKVYEDAIEAGLPESDAAAKALLETQGLLENPPADLDAAAMQFAQRGTFTAELPEGLAGLQKVFNHPMLKVIVPFFRTPANIGLEVLERTPFAPLSSRFREDIAQGGIYRDMALAKVTFGSGLLATFAAFAAEGKISGSGPARKADREALMRDGWTPYSVKVGDQWVSYAGMEPVSALMAIAADYAEYAQRADSDDDIANVFLGGAMGLMEFLKEQPYLQGVADMAKFLQAADGDRAKQFFNDLSKQYGGFVIGGSPAGAYNSMVAGIARLYDPTARDTRASPDLPMGVRGFVEAFNKYRSRLPYFNESLPEQLNLWGDPVLRGQGKPYEMVLPTRVSPVQFSEVDDALVRMGSPVGMPERKIDGVEMNAEQYNQLMSIYGKEFNAKQQLLDTIRMPGFDMLNLDDQQRYVQRVHSKLLDDARKTLIERDPALKAKIGDLQEARKAQGLFYKPD